jgi:hypothetical protein
MGRWVFVISGGKREQELTKRALTSDGDGGALAIVDGPRFAFACPTAYGACSPPLSLISLVV